MLKFFAHCWLVLSLLVAPVQFAVADMAVVDHTEMKCDMMDMDVQHDVAMENMDHSMGQNGCECPEQCKVSCASAHISLGLHNIPQFAKVTTSYKVNALTTSISGIDHTTELRPPRV